MTDDNRATRPQLTTLKDKQRELAGLVRMCQATSAGAKAEAKAIRGALTTLMDVRADTVIPVTHGTLALQSHADGFDVLSLACPLIEGHGSTPRVALFDLEGKLAAYSAELDAELAKGIQS